jgi:phosphoribosylformylglycinamidine cyclo-ligase
MDYKQAGVDIAAGEAAVKAIKAKVRTTFNSNVLSELGSFGGLYKLDNAAWKTPILVSSTDGVGTKLMIAIAAGIYDTVGQDLVNHCTNDILAQGAIPQFFLDYIGVGKLDPQVIEQIIDGFVVACRANRCALIGGEMAEMPGLYSERDFDLAGTIVGLVEADQILPRNICPGDILIGLSSSGLHTNGYSLARKVLFERMKLRYDSYIDELGETLQAALLRVHNSYLDVLIPWLEHPGLHGLAHITGGGIAGNLARILPRDLQAIVNMPEEHIPPLFQLIGAGGKVERDVMRQTFNLGIGMICVINPELADQFVKNINGRVIGEIVVGQHEQPRVIFS